VFCDDENQSFVLMKGKKATIFAMITLWLSDDSFLKSHAQEDNLFVGVVARWWCGSALCYSYGDKTILERLYNWHDFRFMGGDPHEPNA
jgi:hypothetical protein